MVAIRATVRSLSASVCQRRIVIAGLSVVLSAALVSCASTQELYAEYDEQFCPVDGQAVEFSAKLLARNDADSNADSDADNNAKNNEQNDGQKVVERVVIKEVPAAATLAWEPAVYFKSDATSLSKSAKRSLDSNIKLLQKFPRHLVAIRGFTDVHSSEAYNRKLAEQRIGGVKEYLTGQGIAGVRIVGTSHGESLPLAGSQSAIADNINRRVELLLLDSDGRPVTSQQPVVLGPAGG